VGYSAIIGIKCARRDRNGTEVGVKSASGEN
jgi:hypothetical protein